MTSPLRAQLILAIEIHLEKNAVVSSGKLADEIMTILAERGLPTHDPTDLDGAIVGDVGHEDGQPGGIGGVVLDTRNAIIPDYTTCSMVDDAAPETFAAVLIEGRINRRQERARVMLIGSGDALAAWVTELVHLAAAARQSPLRSHRRWAREFMSDLNRRMAGDRS